MESFVQRNVAPGLTAGTSRGVEGMLSLPSESVDNRLMGKEDEVNAKVRSIDRTARDTQTAFIMTVYPRVARG